MTIDLTGDDVRRAWAHALDVAAGAPPVAELLALAREARDFLRDDVQAAGIIARGVWLERQARRRGCKA